jgi:hypothetical protein
VWVPEGAATGPRPVTSGQQHRELPWGALPGDQLPGDAVRTDLKDGKADERRTRFRTCGLCRVKAQSRDFAAHVNGWKPAADLYVRCLLLSVAVPQVPPSCGPSAARTGGERQPLDYAAFSIHCRTGVRYPGSVGTWHDPDLGRPIAAPLERCAELLGVDLATIREVAANVEPYLRADGTRIWSVMQLERQLRPGAYGRRRGGYLDRRRTP